MRFATICSIALALPLLALPQQSTDTQSRTLKVHLNYTGSSKVDENHKVYLALWDSPDFMQGASSAPIAVLSATTKDATLTFSNLDKSPVYVNAAFDPTGRWAADSAPPSGTIIGLYGDGGTPKPINISPGKTETVTLTFDDSQKVP